MFFLPNIIMMMIRLQVGVAEGLGNALFWTDGQRRGVGGGGPGAVDNRTLLLCWDEILLLFKGNQTRKRCLNWQPDH